ARFGRFLTNLESRAAWDLLDRGAAVDDVWSLFATKTIRQIGLRLVIAPAWIDSSLRFLVGTTLGLASVYVVVLYACAARDDLIVRLPAFALLFAPLVAIGR